MRHTLLTLSILIAVCLGVKAQPKLSFDNAKYDFGAIMWKQPATAKFVITNTGNKSLVIHNVELSCGCLEAEYTQEPVKPGGEAEVRATFKAEQPGYFRKTMRVHCNTGQPPVVLRVEGDAE